MHRASTVDLHNGLSHAVVTLIYAELAMHYPRASFQVVNLGGAFAMLVERMARLIADRELCCRMGEAGRLKAEREFGLDRLVASTLATYRTAGWQDEPRVVRGCR